MIIYCCAVLISACLVCHTSAFSTRFVMEGAEKEIKPQTEEVKEIRTQKTEENNVAENQLIPQGIEVQVIPVVSDVFTNTEDLSNMTPLKLATVISAQYLMSTLRNIQIPLNRPQDAFNMFTDIVKEFNKTAEIIKLTAQYINISSHYILSTLEQFINSSCEQEAIGEKMIQVRKTFYNTINDHIAGAVKELNEKTRQREMTGTDILVSSAYHIVTAFQEMTNKVLKITSEKNEKCNSPLPTIEVTPPSGEQTNLEENKTKEGVFNIQPVPEQGKNHKSIKKDQVPVPKTDTKVPQTKFTNFHEQFFTIENLNNNQDLTVEAFSPELILQNKKKESVLEQKHDNDLKTSQELKVEYFPLNTISLFKNPTNEDVFIEDNENYKKRKGAQSYKQTDKELASSAVDSLSNVPWESSEFRAKNLDKPTLKHVEKSPQKLTNILELLAPGYQRPIQYAQNVQKCDEHVDPVCGIDRENKKFIIFLNDCKRNVHNNIHRTNYVWNNMDTCVGLFLRDPNLGAKLAHINRFVDKGLQL